MYWREPSLDDALSKMKLLFAYALKFRQQASDKDWWQNPMLPGLFFPISGKYTATKVAGNVVCVM